MDGWNFINLVVQEWGSKGLRYDKCTDEIQRVFVPLPGDGQQPPEVLQRIQARQMDLARRGFSVVQVLPEGIVYHNQPANDDDSLDKRGVKRSRTEVEPPKDEEATDAEAGEDGGEDAVLDDDETQAPYVDPEETQVDAEPTQIDPS